MKKYITIATLLAAGATLANAEGLTGKAFNTALEKALADAEYTLGDAFSIHCELSGVGNMNSGLITLIDGSYYVVNQEHSYWGLNSSDSNTLTGNGKWTLSVNDNDYTYTSTEGELPILWTQNAEGTGSATRTVGAALNVTISSDGTDSSVVLAYAGSGIVDTFILKGTALDATQISLKDNIGSVSNFEGSVSGVSIAIPEPSVFGLLASVGALALVGVRRRRK